MKPMKNAATEVIILAQGTQSRLGHAHGLKQLLPLPACDGIPIMGRTVLQCLEFTWMEHVQIVSWPEVEEMMSSTMPGWAMPSVVTLSDPGNSALKGIARYLESKHRSARGDLPGLGCARTVVLLGDVVYSWACLETLFLASRDWGFVGTPDLSGSGGELWGIAWSHDAEACMIVSLRDALLRHPPFEEDYQPGQLRRWISGSRCGDITTHVEELRRTGHYVDISDYTHDIDVPDHLAMLPWLSESAATDDAKHGVTWGRP
jgi:hypothetical protein